MKLRIPWQVLRAILSMILGLAALVAIIAWLAGVFENKIPPGQKSIAARRLGDQPSDVVHEVTKEYIEEAIGTLKAASRTVISAKVLAAIEEITVAAGDQVEESQLLVRLDSMELDARLRQAENALQATEATHTEAEAAYRRADQLRESSPTAITQEAFDEYTRRLEVARAEESRARQAVTEAEIQLSYATIEAPKAGRVVDRLAEPGDMARPGEPLLVVYDSRSLRLEAPVMEELALSLKIGSKLKVHVDAINRDLDAKIDEIVPQAEAPSRSFLVKAALTPSNELYEGMFGRLLIPAGERRHVCLDTAAIQHLGQLEFVDVVQEDGTLIRRFIKTGRLGMPGRVEVISGLEPGERVLLYDQPATPAKSG